MTNDQMKKYISTRVTKSDLNPFSRMTYGTITAIIILCVYTIMTVPAAHAEETSGDSTTEIAVSDTGMDAASAVATIVYFPVKAAFSLAGGVVGGLTYAFTGGDEDATKKVWDASMGGDYSVSPGNLTGEEPLHFVGPSPTE